MPTSYLMIKCSYFNYSDRGRSLQIISLFHNDLFLYFPKKHTNKISVNIYAYALHDKKEMSLFKYANSKWTNTAFLGTSDIYANEQYK